jgi:steroid 5-alpha reductase family enzyme
MSYALIRNGRWFAYRRSDYSLILTDDPRFVRLYATMKGARIACARYLAFYGVQLVPSPAPEKSPP